MIRLLKFHWFTYTLSVILVGFMSLMLYVTGIAFSRLSGAAKVDMAHAQKLRTEGETHSNQLKN